MNRDTIRVIGPALRVAIVGAVLSRKWLGGERQLVLMPDAMPEVAQTILARPDHLKLHAELEFNVDWLSANANAIPVLAPSYPSNDGSLALPFPLIGAAQFGVDFHHFWMRANSLSELDDLLAFSPAIAIEKAAQKPALNTLIQACIPFGLELDAGSYAELLIAYAKSQGALVAEVEAGGQYSATIDCSGSDMPGWQDETVHLLAPPRLPGLEWQICLNSANRFASLAANFDKAAAERREYNRLARHEVERIADMLALLKDANPAATKRSTLKRKIDVFAACGRIPTEDFEVFSQPEWLCALWGRGIRPRRFDRMAGLMPESKLSELITGLHSKARALAGEVL